MNRILIPLTATALLIGGVSSALAEGETVSAYGSGQFAVTPTDSKSEAVIRAAVADAQAKALPVAVEDAKVKAKALADAAGLNLGAIFTVSQEAANPGGFFGFGGVVSYGGGPPFGQFGGNFCGVVSRAITKRVRVNGVVRNRVVRRVRERKCIVPAAVQQTVEVTFRATPKV